MRIAFVGGGSLTWMPELMTDLALTPELHGATVVLQDVDPPSLERTLPLCRLIAHEARSDMRLEATLERQVALRDARFVVFCVGTGGLEGMRADLEIPARYGIRQPVGCTVGPGGLNRARRWRPARGQVLPPLPAPRDPLGPGLRGRTHHGRAPRPDLRLAGRAGAVLALRRGPPAPEAQPGATGAAHRRPGGGPARPFYRQRPEPGPGTQPPSRAGGGVLRHAIRDTQYGT